MYMNSASHLLPEDRPAFERVLDEALRGVVAGNAGEQAPRLTADQLRTRAMGALTAIAACATEEYSSSSASARSGGRAAAPHPAPRRARMRASGQLAPGIAPQTRSRRRRWAPV